MMAILFLYTLAFPKKGKPPSFYENKSYFPLFIYCNF